MWFSSRYSSTSGLTSLNLAQHLDLEQSSKASSESTSSTSSTASTESSGTSNMATRSGKNTGIQPSGRKTAAIKSANRGGGTEKGVTVNKMNIEAVRKSASRKKNKTAPSSNDDGKDESALVDGDASENEIQNTVTQNSDNEDNEDEENDEESSIGNVPHYCSLMKIIELTLLIVCFRHRITNNFD